MHSDREFKEAPLPLHAHQELKKLTVENILVIKGAKTAGKSPKQLNLAEKTGVLVIAIGRGEELLLHRLAETVLDAGDIVYCIGRKTDLSKMLDWFDPALEKNNLEKA
jgi:K+/H+ antiporter YhaU regulatory subunit KhtT